MKKLFEENAYAKEIETKIKREKKKNSTVELEKTVFYGKSGGQPGDTGQIIIGGQKIEVKDTLRDKNRIINILEDVSGINIGQKITARINWQKRYKHMRMHSALHLICAAVPLGVTGGQIGYDKSRLDFNDPEKKINKEELQITISNLLNKDHEIKYEYIDSKILDNKPELVRTMSVKPPKIDGKLRFVKIGTIDFQPCGGTHVKSTNEIDLIKIGKIENKGKMNKRVNITLND